MNLNDKILELIRNTPQSCILKAYCLIIPKNNRKNERFF